MELDRDYAKGGAQPTVVTEKIQTAGRDTDQPISHYLYTRERMGCLYIDQSMLFQVISRTKTTSAQRHQRIYLNA